MMSEQDFELGREDEEFHTPEEEVAMDEDSGGQEDAHGKTVTGGEATSSPTPRANATVSNQATDGSSTRTVTGKPKKKTAERGRSRSRSRSPITDDSSLNKVGKM